MYLKKSNNPYKVEERDIYTEFELYDPDFDMIVYHKIKQLERKEKRGLIKKVEDEKKNIA